MTVPLRHGVTFFDAPASLVNAMGWNQTAYPLTFSRVGASWTSSFNRNDYVPNSLFPMQYYVSPTGIAGNTGLTVDSPKNSINACITLGNATGAGYQINIAAGTYPRSLGVNNNNSIFPTQHCALVATGGRVVTGTFETLTWSGTKDATQANCTTTSRTNVGKVVDLTQLNADGDYTIMTHVTTAALCNSTPNSWVLVGSILYVHRTDEALATNTNTRVYLVSVGSALMLTAPGKNFYAYNIDCEGGTGSAVVTASVACVGVVHVFENCTSKYGGRNDGTAANVNGYDTRGSGLFVFNGGQVSSHATDGINAHWQVDSTRASNVLTQNVKIYNVGLEPTSNSNNCLTGHETVNMIDVMSICRRSKGGTVRSINDAHVACFGTDARFDAVDSGVSNPVIFRIENTGIMYLVDCTAETNNAGDDAAIAIPGGSPAAILYTRNFNAVKGLITNTKAMPPYLP